MSKWQTTTVKKKNVLEFVDVIFPKGSEYRELLLKRQVLSLAVTFLLFHKIENLQKSKNTSYTRQFFDCWFSKSGFLTWRTFVTCPRYEINFIMDLA